MKLPTSYRPPSKPIRAVLLSLACLAKKSPPFNKTLLLFSVMAESAVVFPANKFKFNFPASAVILLLTTILPSACNVSVASAPAVLVISAFFFFFY
ncbi:hypothetical protein, partial [Yersinia pestis]|uniref:hypothetical protein n=1 Tax=Yersinia pestis TaxID=632 RepID=UPI0019808C57